MLIDELEAHLHPRWQRSILSSVLRLAESLHANATIQLIAATHSPLVLASAEPTFDAEQDAWFDLDLEKVGNKPQVMLRKREPSTDSGSTTSAGTARKTRSAPGARASRSAC